MPAIPTFPAPPAPPRLTMCSDFAIPPVSAGRRVGRVRLHPHLKNRALRPQPLRMRIDRPPPRLSRRIRFDVRLMQRVPVRTVYRSLHPSPPPTSVAH